MGNNDSCLSTTSNVEHTWKEVTILVRHGSNCFSVASQQKLCTEVVSMKVHAVSRN